jgi:hypothetical protein
LQAHGLAPVRGRLFKLALAPERGGQVAMAGVGRRVELDGAPRRLFGQILAPWVVDPRDGGMHIRRARLQPERSQRRFQSGAIFPRLCEQPGKVHLVFSALGLALHRRTDAGKGGNEVARLLE